MATTSFPEAMAKLKNGLSAANNEPNAIQKMLIEETIAKQEKSTGKPITAEARAAQYRSALLTDQASLYGMDFSNIRGNKAIAALQNEAMTIMATDLVTSQETAADIRNVPTGAFEMQTVEKIDTSAQLRTQLQKGLSAPVKKPTKTTRQVPTEDPGILGMAKGKHVKMAPPTTRRPQYLHRHPQELSPLAMYDEDRLAYQREMSFRRPIPGREASAPTSPLRMTPLS